MSVMLSPNSPDIADTLCPIRMKKLSIILSVLLLISCKQVNKQIAIDSCLDKGGRWNYELNICDYGTTQRIDVAEKNEKHINLKSTERGLILPIDNNKDWSPCCLYIPRTSLNLYKAPNDKPIGKLRLINKKQSSEFYESEIVYLNGETETFEMDNFEMVGYEIFALKFISSNDSFLQLENNLWIKTSELKKQGLIHKSWMRYAIEEQDVLGWYGNKPGIELKHNPDEDSEQIKLLEGDLLEISLSEELKGEWMKVYVNEYQMHPCSDPSIKPIKSYSGWLKLISKNGTLNVWSYRKGC